MNIVTNTSEFIKIINSEGVILSATDTIWGLQCDSFSEKSYKKIFALKKRKSLTQVFCILV